MQSITLFCLPYSGGNVYSFRNYEQAAPSFLRIKTLEYPGRGNRAKEKLLVRAGALVEDVFRQISNRLTPDYAIYGHSMGGLIAYLLAQKILEAGLLPPMHLFISGTVGPSVSYDDKSYLLSRDALIQKLRLLNGIPAPILDDEELFGYFEPILRADFEISETYVHIKCKPLPVPITVITGSEEDLQEADVLTWQQETTCKVDFRKLPGGHFFIYEHGQKVMQIIAGKLQSDYIIN